MRKEGFLPLYRQSSALLQRHCQIEVYSRAQFWVVIRISLMTGNTFSLPTE